MVTTRVTNMEDTGPLKDGERVNEGEAPFVPTRIQATVQRPQDEDMAPNPPTDPLEEEDLQIEDPLRIPPHLRVDLKKP
jgi:hypothetical protein